MTELQVHDYLQCLETRQASVPLQNSQNFQNPDMPSMAVLKPKISAVKIPPLTGI